MRGLGAAGPGFRLRARRLASGVASRGWVPIGVSRMLWREGPVATAASQTNVVSALGQSVAIAQQNPASSRAAATAMMVRRLPRCSMRDQT